MLLAIDAGNTNTVFALCDGKTVLKTWRIATQHQRTEDEYLALLTQVMQFAGYDIAQVSAVMIATVVPQTLFALKRLAQHHLRLPPLVVGEAGVALDMEIAVDRPSEVGADRIVNAVAGRERYGNNLILLDFGTATTFDIVDEAGRYAGGVIAPGIHLSLDALHRAAAKLPNIAIEPPAKVVGTSTTEAMQSGVYYGYLGLIEGIITRIRAAYPHPMTVVATGGLAPLFAKATPMIAHLDSDLTIRGLQLLYARNHGRAAAIIAD